MALLIWLGDDDEDDDDDYLERFFDDILGEDDDDDDDDDDVSPSTGLQQNPPVQAVQPAETIQGEVPAAADYPGNLLNLPHYPSQYTNFTLLPWTLHSFSVSST